MNVDLELAKIMGMFNLWESGYVIDAIDYVTSTAMREAWGAEFCVEMVQAIIRERDALVESM